MSAAPTLLPLRTQLGTGPTAGDDCSVVTMANALRWASRGKVGPDAQSDVGRWAHQIRTWAGAPTDAAHSRGLRFRTETLRAYRDPNVARLLSAAGHSLTATYHYRAPWKAVFRALARGNAVHLPVQYGVLRRSGAPMGSSTFGDGHSVLLVGYVQNPRHQVLTWDGDPLFDGRRPDIPHGWQHVRGAFFRDAAGRWSGATGCATFIELRRG